PTPAPTILSGISCRKSDGLAVSLPSARLHDRRLRNEHLRGTMAAQKKDSVVLLIHCQDRKGIVARVSGFIHDFGGNILDSDHHTDEETNDFLMRMEFATDGLQ